jgi:hypothetical protein
VEKMDTAIKKRAAHEGQYYVDIYFGKNSTKTRRVNSYFTEWK